MTPDAFIEETIAAGQQVGVAALRPEQRLVWLISEAEVLCDMEGIDAFLDRYREWLPETAAAFEAVGAQEIAAALRAIRPEASRDDPLLDRINELITHRAGYSYAAIRRLSEQPQTGS